MPIEIIESRFTDNNHVELLRNGAEYFPALEREITRAQYEIYLQTYNIDSTYKGQMLIYHYNFMV